MRKLSRWAVLKKPKIIIPLVVILVIAAAIIATVKNMNAPAQGSISQTPPAQAEHINPYAQPGAYSGKYISFKYPPHFKKTPSKLTGQILETADYHSTDLSGKLISVSVQAGSLSTSSDIHFRRQQPAIYKENDSQKWIEFTRNDGTEDSFFLQHGGLLASVSATSLNGGLSNEAFFVASGLKWTN